VKHGTAASRPPLLFSGENSLARIDASAQAGLVFARSGAIERCFPNSGSGVKTVNKNDLVSLIADRTGFSKVDAGKAVDSVLGAITEALQSGTSVRLSGFGTFTISKRAASEGRHPRTGEKIQLPESTHPKFRAGKQLREAVN
jgi:DNA-binding protein HU-beta